MIGFFCCVDTTSGRAALGTLVNFTSGCVLYSHLQILLKRD